MVERLDVYQPAEIEKVPGNFVYLFPGQGIQTVGMGERLYRNSDVARTIFDQIPPGLLKVMLTGPQEILDMTVVAQPAIVSVGYAAYVAFLEANPSFQNRFPIAAAGHSLGQVTALIAAGVVDFPTGLRIATERGRLMQREGNREENKGGMVVLLGSTQDQAEMLCIKAMEEFSLKEGISVANDNTVGQLVISGKDELIVWALLHAKEEGIKRAARLPISIASHSSLMRKAQEDFALLLKDIPFAKPLFPLALNGAGEITDNPQRIKQDIINALTSGVKFRQCLEALRLMGAGSFLEIGEGPLSGFVQRATENTHQFQIQFN